MIKVSNLLKGYFRQIMQVFKFGGASIRNASAIRNMANIIENYGDRPLVVVVSAMGKTTRLLEQYIEAIVNKEDTKPIYNQIIQYHQQIVGELFSSGNSIFKESESIIYKITKILWDAKNYGKYYDSIVSVGELLASAIILAYLKEKDVLTCKVDATTIIKCRGKFQSAKIDWPLTKTEIKAKVLPELDKRIVLTQGFIGSNDLGEVMTLGKEGSDFTAAIIASCLNAKKVTIWKDVPGILTADPKLISGTKQIMQLNYSEASEMTYYGASVIHPKTIKPLANKEIPLYVRSFDHPELKPTKIGVTEKIKLEPSLIVKKNQCLFTFRVRDYTFVNEEILAKIFSTLHQLDITLNILQSSAITVSVCFDFKQSFIDALYRKLQDHFTMQYMTGLELITLKNYDKDSLAQFMPKDEIIIEQRSRRNCRFLVRIVA